MENIHGTANKMTFCIENTPYPLIIDCGGHLSIVARESLDKHFPNWEQKLLKSKAKNFKIASGKMKSIGTIIKEIIIPHRKGNIRLKPGFVVHKDVQIQGFLLGTDYKIIHCIDIRNINNRHITIGQFSYQLSSKQKHSLLKILRKNKIAFAIGGECLGNVRGHNIGLHLDVERPYSPILRRPPYQEILETRKEVEKRYNEQLDMYVIRNIGCNEIVEVTTPVLINWHDGKSRFFGDFGELKYYTKADR
ncbi:hypothetical protein O181_059564 [Austropuccinia psidii MF-1]|uniref:Uncharacterized protein n=1 Tax=Austropuccinia psidii MF-1 TaxID=1389203 RepID=A0A9Q3HYR7_9BASI|nr:hypothetical protein [Austropuccinia psidii MF-1]